METPTETQKRREMIDTIANTIIERAQEMIKEDIPVILAFRLAISFELEVQMLRAQVDLQRLLVTTEELLNERKNRYDRS